MKRSHDAGSSNRSAPDATPERQAEMRSRLVENMARVTHEAGGGAAPSRVTTALAMAILVVIAFAVGAMHRLPDRLNAAILLGPGGSNPLPVAAFTPGAVHHTTAAELCAPQRRIDRVISSRVRLAVLRDYRMETVPPFEYELDYLITPELGGAPTRQNLWPERYASRVWNARVKDQLELLLPRLVCEGHLDLATAQRDMAGDWIAAYKKYFRTNVPLAQVARIAVDDNQDEIDDIVVETAQFAVLAQLTWRQ
jgi:hypothetical protein